MSSQKYQYSTQVGVVVVKALRNSAGKVTGYEGFMLGDDDFVLADTRRVVQVYESDEVQLRNVRHALKDVVFDVFLAKHPEMAMKREKTRIAEGVAKIVHKHLCIGARERNLIPS
jgi:hypothetical protein